MAHFHYTIMGGLVFTFFAAIYYWLPKMTGFAAQRAAREDPLLDDVHLLQLDVLPALHRRLPRTAAARRHVSERPAVPQRLGLGVCVLPRHLDARLPFQPHLVTGIPEGPGRGESLGIPLDRVPAPVAGPGSRLRPYPGLLERSLRLRRRGDAEACCRPERQEGGTEEWPSRSHTKAPATRWSRKSLPSFSPGTSSRRATCSPVRPHSSSSPSSSAYFYLRALDNGGMWKPTGVDASVGWGTAVVVCYVASALLVRFGLIHHGAERRDRWRLEGVAALLVGIAGLVVQVVRVDARGLRSGGRRLRERLLRLDGLPVPVRARDAALAGDDPRDVVPVPQDPERDAPPPARRRAIHIGWRTTSATRSRSSAPSSSGSASTGRSSRRSRSSPGSSST